MYAHAVAKLNEAKALYAAAKASAKTTHATLKEVKAERAAAAALQAAQDEADAWKAAVAADSDAQEQAEIAEADAYAKHATMMNATASAANATAARKAAEDASAHTKIVSQQLVNDAAAEASAVWAHNAKVAAAAAAETDRAAKAEADAKNAIKKEETKKSMQYRRKAIHNEWHAAHKSASAQAAAIAAASASATGDLVAKVANITALMNLTALIQQPVVTVENDTMLDVIKANASAAVQAAETLVSEAASDEKKAAAALAVAKYAADTSAHKMKVSQSKADSAYKKAMAAMHAADAATRKAKDAAEGTVVAEWVREGASGANISATLTVPIAQNATYNTAAALRDAKDAESGASATLQGITDAAMREKVIDASITAEGDATDTANQAAASRIVSDYEEWAKANAVAAAENATAYLKRANTEYHDDLKLSNKAESTAVHGANQAQKWDEKSAAAALDDSINVTNPAAEDPVAQQEESAVVVTKVKAVAP